METRSIESLSCINDLVGAVHASEEPVVVFDGDDECMVAMRPAVLERLLFDSSLLNATDRETLRL